MRVSQRPAKEEEEEEEDGEGEEWGVGTLAHSVDWDRGDRCAIAGTTRLSLRRAFLYRTTYIGEATIIVYVTLTFRHYCTQNTTQQQRQRQQRRRRQQQQQRQRQQRQLWPSDHFGLVATFGTQEQWREIRANESP